MKTTLRFFQTILPIIALCSLGACAGSGDASTKKYPVAKRVPGEDGLVFSPFASTTSYVDVKGLERGTVVKDPYTNDFFRVP